MLDTTTIQTEAPLDALYVHSFNPRADRPDSDAEADDIRALAGSIAAAGLQYPLACLRTDDTFGVVDGRRRLLALQHLARHPELDSDAVATRPIPLRITEDEDTARAWAVIPATTTMRLHPADEIRAFAAQAAQGTAPDEIALIYGVSPRLVQGRLRLAALPDTALETGAMTIGPMEAAVRKYAPTVVYMHTKHDTHQDHRATHDAGLVAFRNVPNLYCYQSPSTTTAFSPTRYADVSEVLQGKLELIEAYRTQTSKCAYLEPDLLEATARYWGRFAGYRHVEPLEVLRESEVLRCA